MMKRVTLIAFLMTIAAPIVLGQDFSRVQLVGTYTLANADNYLELLPSSSVVGFVTPIAPNSKRKTANGFRVGVDYNLGPRLGVAMEVDRDYFGRLDFPIQAGTFKSPSFQLCGEGTPSPAGCYKAQLSAGTASYEKGRWILMAGPRMSHRMQKGLSFFEQALFGVCRNAYKNFNGSHALNEIMLGDITGYEINSRVNYQNSDLSHIGFAMGVSAGVDLKLAKRLALRLLQVEYLGTAGALRGEVGVTKTGVTTYQYPAIPNQESIKNGKFGLNLESGFQHNFRFSTGLVVPF